MKKIGIVVATDEEKKEIDKIIVKDRIEKIYNLQFEVGKINNIECVMVKCGVGKVNSARTTQILIDKYQVDEVINVGVGGCINDELNIGDVVISNKIVQHDFDLTAFDHKKGYVPEVGDYIQCNKDLVNQFSTLINNLSNDKFKTKIGVIVSGDIFCTDENHKRKIKEKFNADVVDMECAAIAQVAFLSNIPFIGIRSISDIPNGDNKKTFEENVEFASKRCAQILDKYCNLY